MDDHVHKIEQHPAAGLHTFNVMGRKSDLIHRMHDTVGKPAYVCIRRAGRNHEVVGGVAQSAEVKHLNPDPLAVLDRGDRDTYRRR